MRSRSFVLSLLSLVGLWSCIIVRGNWEARDEAITPTDQRRSIYTRVKAHLADGASVIYLRGVDIRGGWLLGRGMRYDFTLRDSTVVDSLPLASVVAMESFHETMRPVETVLLSAVATVGTVAILKALFGSCPTIYSDSAGTPVLEAEGFSYSIAPMFERRNVDRLRAQPDADDTLRLEIRNEALETHFINHLELLAVSHANDEWVGPDGSGQPVAVRNLLPPARAVDRRGRDILADIRTHDGRVFQSTPGALDAATVDDLEDWIDLEIPVPAGTDSLALTFRMRNSLLATVLFYDLMLADHGPDALDWMARDLARIGPAVRLGRWATSHLGLRLSVFDGRTYRPVARLGDSGPIAWQDVVAVVPTFGRRVVAVRLSFTADNWRIDRIAGAPEWRRLVPRVLPLVAVHDAAARSDAAVLAALAAPDDRYLETTSGQRLEVRFAVTPAAYGTAQTFFLASQGYYLEWVRRDWLAAGQRRGPFRPENAALLDAMRRWHATQAETERRFYATRIPVR